MHHLRFGAPVVLVLTGIAACGGAGTSSSSTTAAATTSTTSTSTTSTSTTSGTSSTTGNGGATGGTASGAGGIGGATTSAGEGGAGGQGGALQGSGGAGGQEVVLPICINELMPRNLTAALDEKGSPGDWIELHNPGAAPIDLSGWTISDDPAVPFKNPFPMGLSIPAKGFLLLWADEKVPLGPTHLGFKLAGSGGVVALYPPAGPGSVVAYGNMDIDHALARKPDCCVGGGCLQDVFLGTPGQSNLSVAQVTESLVPVGSVYRYIDTNVAPPAAWTTTAFDDSALPSGPAPLGYGDAHIITNVASGLDPANKYITTWFRRSFPVSGASTFTSAHLTLLRDDGARVFLNGAEIARSNLPAGAIDASTLAPVGATGAEETMYFDFDVDPSLLVEGTNVLAVEIHQSSASSSDLGFDASLTGKKPGP